MQRQRTGKKWAGQWLAFIVIGLGIGWLAGLSASPVLSTILGSILGALGGIVAGMKATRLRSWIDARPLALVVLAIAFAAPFGVLVRSHHLLEPEPVAPAEVEGEAEAKDAQSTPHSLYAGVLFSHEGAEQCARLLGSPDQNLRSALQTSSFKWGQLLADAVDDTQELRRLVEELCSS